MWGGGLAFGRWGSCHTKEALPDPRSQKFTSVFSSKNFIVLARTFRSIIHLESLFMSGSKFVYLHAGTHPLVPAPLLGTSLSPLYGTGVSVGSQLTLQGSFWTLRSVLLICISGPTPPTMPP